MENRYKTMIAGQIRLRLRGRLDAQGPVRSVSTRRAAMARACRWRRWSTSSTPTCRSWAARDGTLPASSRASTADWSSRTFCSRDLQIAVVVRSRAGRGSADLRGAAVWRPRLQRASIWLWQRRLPWVSAGRFGGSLGGGGRAFGGRRFRRRRLGRLRRGGGGFGASRLRRRLGARGRGRRLWRFGAFGPALASPLPSAPPWPVSAAAGV